MDAERTSFRCFATFAYFGTLRETGLPVDGLTHTFKAFSVSRRKEPDADGTDKRASD